MDTAKTVLDMVRPGMFFTSIDLTDAYYCVNVDKDFRKYLCFFWNGKLYRFTCLPQGLTISPRIYTKIMKVAISSLRENNIIISAYIDDLIIMSYSHKQCAEDFNISVNLLERLGFVINWEKSDSTPRQNIQHLGLVIDSNSMTVKVNNEKINNIIDICKNLLEETNTLILTVTSVIGTMVSYLPGAEHGHLHYRCLEHCKNEALKTNQFNYNKRMILNPNAIDDLNWWINNINSQSTNLNTDHPSHFIKTDSSLSGWGAVMDDTVTNGFWTQEEKQLHINVLELKAIEFGLKALCSEISNEHIRIKCDNTTAVAYINSKGGSKSMQNNYIAKNIWQWAIDRDNAISAEHLPGILNIEADYESRKQHSNKEWMLDNDVYETIIKHFNVTPTIDLFASRLNKKISRFISWKPDPEAECVDTFSQHINNEIFYAFPPFSIINKFLKKVELEQMEGILIAPAWSTQNYFPFLIKLSIQLPIAIKWRKNLLLDPTNLASHPLQNKLKLYAFHLSTNHSKKLVFQKQLQILCCKAGENPPLNNISVILKNGNIFVNKLVKITPKLL